MKKIELQKHKKYSICSCGLSKTLPFFDHAHRKYNEKNGTNYKSVKIIADETVTVNMDSSTWNIK